MYAYKTKSWCKNTPDSVFPRTLTCDLLSKATHLDCHMPIFLNTFFSEIIGLFDGVFKIVLGHMTKMAAIPIYGKTKSVSL